MVILDLGIPCLQLTCNIGTRGNELVICVRVSESFQYTMSEFMRICCCKTDRNSYEFAAFSITNNSSWLRTRYPRWYNNGYIQEGIVLKTILNAEQDFNAIIAIIHVNVFNVVTDMLFTRYISVSPKGRSQCRQAKPCFEKGIFNSLFFGFDVNSAPR